MSAIETILARLDRVRRTGANRWTARCPSHDDKGPSLSLADHDGKVLLHCFAGCEALAVVEAVGLRMEDLFPEPIERDKPLRKPFPAADVLACVREESKLVWMMGKRIQADEPVAAEDWERFKLAVERIEAAWELANG